MKWPFNEFNANLDDVMAMPEIGTVTGHTIEQQLPAGVQEHHRAFVISHQS
jgi:hypothetical protein